MIRRALGVVLVASPFVGLGALIASSMGWAALVVVFGGAAVVSAMIIAGMSLLYP
jgi:hypothetical protein